MTTSPPPDDLGDLRALLAWAGLTQREYARRLGYGSNGVVQMVLRGRRDIPLADLPDWAAHLGLSPQDQERFVQLHLRRILPPWLYSRCTRLRFIPRRCSKDAMEATLAFIGRRGDEAQGDVPMKAR
jgi:transcriptional regulator with XRE-family HTH domain